MSLNSILNSGASGLLVAQTQLRTISDNIANINTPGYARRVVDQQSISLGEMGGGVAVSGVRRVVDQFLQQAGLNAAADAGSAAALSEMLDRAQTLFGDPSGDASFFGKLDGAFQAFSAASLNPTSAVSRSQALNTLNDFLNQAGQVTDGLRDMRAQADSQIGSTIGDINQLLSQIDGLNTSITRAMVSGQDASVPQNAQAELIDKLSSLIDVTLQPGADGRTTVRGPGGGLLVGANGAATLSYKADGSAPGQITASIGGAGATTLTPTTGTVRGLLDLRNSELPAIGAQVGEYATRAVDEINRAHNASSSVPAPSTLNGRNTGLDMATAVSGFSGKTTVAVVDASGVIQKRVEIDFDGGTMTSNGVASAFTPSSFVDSLNGALGGSATASFSGGALGLAAAGPGTGVAIADDAANPSQKVGKGFSHFFGLNDLITSTGTPYTATGLKASDPSGFTGQISLRLSNADGAPLRDVTVQAPAGGSMADLLSALNASSTGVGLYGAFSLDDQGQLAFKPNANGASLSVVGDATARGAGGPSISQLFGLGASQSEARGSSFSIRSDVAADASKLAFGKLDLGAAAGAPALAAGDNRGALALAAAAQATTTFAGGSGVKMTLAQYGAQLSGLIGQRAAAAESRQTNAEAIASEASSRRSSVEGVNLDEELVQLTTYQQSYNASARLISAAKDMYDVLLNMT